MYKDGFGFEYHMKVDTSLITEIEISSFIQADSICFSVIKQ